MNDHASRNLLSAAFAVLAVLLMTPTAAATGKGFMANDPAAGCRPQVTGTGTVLSGRFWASETNIVEMPFGQSAVIVGKLSGTDGAQAANVTLTVRESLIVAGAIGGNRVALPRIGFARTTADGSYAYRVPPGPNREVFVSYRDQALCALRYFATTRPTLNAAPTQTRNRGRPVRFSGRLPGPRAGDRIVILQTQVGERWLTFRHAKTDRHGRFRVRYRFNRTFRPTTYTFRVLAPSQSGYPWLSGASRSVPVVVYRERG